MTKRKEERRSEKLHRMDQILKELQEFTKECREDMHEPDNQGIDAWIVGNHLDNAFGNAIVTDLMNSGSQEFIVVMENQSTDKQMKINLADLIALARKALV